MSPHAPSQAAAATPADGSAAAVVPTPLGSSVGLLLAIVRGLFAGTTDRALVQRNALLAFSVRVASAGLLYLSQIILARWMGASEFGAYVLAWTWVLVLGGLSHLGLSMAMIRLLPEYVETQQWALLRGLVRGGRLIALGIGTAVAVLGVATVHLLGTRIAPQTSHAVMLALACVPLYALTDIQDGIGRGRGWMGVALIPPYIVRPSLLLIGMIIAHELGATMCAVTAAGVAIAATAGAALVQTGLVARRLSAEVPSGPRAYAFKAWFTISMPLLVIYGAELVMQNADVILLAMHRPAAEVGMYFAAAKTMALVMFVHYAVGSAAAHRFSALKARGDEAGLARAVRDGVRWTFLPSLAAALALLALGKPLLSLFSPEFTSAYPVMAILVVGFLARASVGPAEFLLNMLGQQRAVAAVAVSAAVIDICLCAVLIPKFGMLGAALANAATLVFAATAYAAVAYRRLGMKIFVLSHLRAP
jgi:O-antigen/teichoic acid export membrane protein